MMSKYLTLALALATATTAVTFDDVPACSKWCVKLAEEKSSCTSIDGAADPGCMCSSYSMTNSTDTSSSSSSYYDYENYAYITAADYAYLLCSEEPRDCSETDFNLFAQTLDTICFNTNGSAKYTCGEGGSSTDEDDYYDYYGGGGYYSYSIPAVSTTTVSDYYDETPASTVTFAPLTLTTATMARTYVSTTILVEITLRGETVTSTTTIDLYTARCPLTYTYPGDYDQTVTPTRTYPFLYNVPTPHIGAVAESSSTILTTYTDASGSVITSSAVVAPSGALSAGVSGSGSGTGSAAASATPNAAAAGMVMGGMGSVGGVMVAAFGAALL